MGLRDLFNKEGREVARIRKLIRFGTDKYRQPYERQKALLDLQKIGTHEAIYGMLKRFTVTVPNSTVDEEEKEMVIGTLIDEFSHEAIEPVMEYLLAEERLSFPLRYLAAVLPVDEYLGRICGLLERLAAQYLRDNSKIVQLVDSLGELRDPRVVVALMSYLDHHDDDVVVAVIDVLERQADEVARKPFIELLIQDEERPRVKRRAAEALLRLDWPVTGFTGQVEKNMPSGFRLNAQGRVRSGPRSV